MLRNFQQKRREHDSSLAQLLDDRVGSLTYELQREQGLLQDEIKQLTQIYDVRKSYEKRIFKRNSLI